MAEDGDGGIEDAIDRVFLAQLRARLEELQASSVNRLILEGLLEGAPRRELADSLGIARSTLYEHIDQLGEELHEFLDRRAPDTSSRRSDTPR